jgi:hypothetical protein
LTITACRVSKSTTGRSVPRRGLGATFLTCRQPQRCQDADVEPADIELVPTDRQARRGGKGVMVVVQFLAADQDAPGLMLVLASAG